MATFLNRVKTLGSELSDGISERLKHALEQQVENAEDAEDAAEAESSGALTNGSAVSINIETAALEDLRTFIRRQAAHISRLETRCREVIDAYKKIAAERAQLQKDLRQKNESDQQIVEQLQEMIQKEKAAKETRSEE